LRLAVLHGLEADDARLELLDALFQHGGFALARSPARGEDLLLRAPFVHAEAFRRQFGGPCNRFGVVTLGQQTGFECDEGSHLALENFELRKRLRGVELDQDLIFLDKVAVLHEDILDDAALQMLDDALIRLHGDKARRVGKASERRDHGPDTEDTKHDKGDKHADALRRVDAGFNAGCFRVLLRNRVAQAAQRIAAATGRWD
jgi:hypothetical protein